MRVLVLHNRYAQPGGEDSVVDEEYALLEHAGHAVERLIVDNADLGGVNGLAAARVAANALWSRSASELVRGRIARFRPDVVHVHNTFPRLSPSVYAAGHAAGVSVVQTLHNFRMLCPNALLFRDGHICHECVGARVPWRGVLHACYRDSRAQTGVAAALLTGQRVQRARGNPVDIYIALTDFARRLFISGGLPADTLVVKPNFLSRDPGERPSIGEYCLFVGRLTAEKGVRTLLDAWLGMDAPPPLRVAGAGPLANEVTLAVCAQPAITYLGQLPREHVLEQMRGARLLVVTSEWHENFPMTIVEAFACGVPVLSTSVGGLSEIVQDGNQGWLTPPGDAAALAARVERLWADTDGIVAAGHAARRAFEQHYSAAAQLPQLLAVYERAITGANARTRPS